MDSHRDEYTIDPETGQQIKVGTPTWKRLAAKYYMIDGVFTDQLISDSRTFASNKSWDENTRSTEAAKKPKHAAPRKRVGDPKGELKYLIVGSKTWNERYLEYMWNGHEFGEKRKRPLPESMNPVEKRRETQQNTFYTTFDRTVAEGRLLDVIDSTLGYALTYYHTVEGDMYKEWMNEKRIRKDFRY